MHKYNGKSKCSCGKRAKYRVIWHGANRFACEEHKEVLEGMEDYKEDNHYTEADHQTWMRV